MRRLFLAASAAFILAGTSPSPAAPAEVIFLRHGEKPAKGAHLNARGRERARALPALFARDPRVLEHGGPVAIFAAFPPKPGGSVRSIETMTPTAAALGMPIDTRFNRDQIEGLARAILDTPAFAGRTVVVCWEHKKIPRILAALGWSRGPNHWDDAVFDRLWIVDFSNGRPVRFRNLPEKVLPGDSTNEASAISVR